MNIKQIAEAAGVSVATVSRVLNHPENVAPKTREKIQINVCYFGGHVGSKSINASKNAWDFLDEITY